MKLSPQQSVTTILLALGLQLELAAFSADAQQALRSRLIDKCCQVGKERAIESAKFNCKLAAREALLESRPEARANLLAMSSAAELILAKDATFADQCEMVLESCCMAFHRNKNCDAGKQFAKSGAFCMDVELSKEASIATESFNDCCMACSLGVLAARNVNETNNSSPNAKSKCKLLSPLASSLSGQLYEQTYVECCQENLPRASSALLEPGAPIDCVQSNPCSQRCLPAGRRGERDRCDCFAGYKLTADGVTCNDVDECKLNLHSCNKQEICDNTLGSFRCMARHQLEPDEQQLGASSDDNNKEAAAFNPLRLCPLNFRWSLEEGRCLKASSSNQQQVAGAGGASLSGERSSERSASLTLLASRSTQSRFGSAPASEWRR